MSDLPSDPAQDPAAEAAVPDESGALTRGELQDRALTGALWTMLHTFIAIPLAFVVNLVVANILQVENYGRLAFLTTLMQVASGIVSLGLAPAVLQFGAKAHARGDREEVRSLLSASQGFRLLVAAPLLTVVVVLVAQVDTTYLVLASVFGIWVPAALGGAPLCLSLENRTAEGAKVAMVTNLFVQAAVLGTVLIARTADTVWASRLIVAGLLVVLALIPISRDYRTAVLRPTLPRGFPPGFWRFALPTGLAGLVATLVLSRTEVFFLTALGSEAAVGLFALAYGVASHVFAPAEALVGPLVPAVSGLREIAVERVEEAFGRAARGTTTLVSIVVVLGVAPMAALVPFLYRGFDAAAPFVIVLGLAGALTVASGTLSAFVLARYSATQILTSNLVALAVNVGAAFAFIPHWGAWGAVWANALGATTRFVLLLAAEVSSLKLPVGRALAPWSSLVVAGVACVCGWLASSTISVHAVVAAVVAGLVSCAAFVVGLRLTRSGLEQEDIDAVTRVLPPRVRATVGRVIELTLRVRRA